MTDLQSDLKGFLKLVDNGFQVADKDWLGTLFAEVDQSCSGMSLHPWGVVVVQDQQEGWDDLEQRDNHYWLFHGVVY